MTEWFNSLVVVIQGLYQMALDAWAWFVGGGLIRDVVGWLASVLPDPSPLADYFEYVTDFVAQMMPWLQLIAMVAPVNLVFIVAAIVLAVELALAVPRVWAWVLKLAPFA